MSVRAAVICAAVLGRAVLTEGMYGKAADADPVPRTAKPAYANLAPPPTVEGRSHRGLTSDSGRLCDAFQVIHCQLLL